MVLELTYNENKICLITTYLPHYGNGRNLKEYIDVLAKIDTVTIEHGINYSIFMRHKLS